MPGLDMKLGTINKLLAVAIVIGLAVLLLQRMPHNKKLTVLLNEVAKPEVAVKQAKGFDAATHYAPDENLEGMDIGILDHAKQEVDAAMYSFTDKPIEHELERLAKQGVLIRLYRDREQYNEEKQRAAENGETCVTDMLARIQNVQVKVKSVSEDLMHEKDFEVDRQLLRTGSANWSYGGLRKQDNVVIYSQSTTDVGRFRRKFAEMWERSDNEVLP
jgi:phosphatidylserine/phosphatidylglycerophosphate/cardiolipin synthase-like enzyme